MPKAELDISASIAERARDFVGHEWLFAVIDRWLATLTPPATSSSPANPALPSPSWSLTPP
jgi:hypothetical protein